MKGYKHQCDGTKVIIFDWDDTICPSSFVDQLRIDTWRDLSADVQRTFDEISRSAERCLREASKYGEVLIITNSDEGWVKYSCERYIPSLLPVVERYRVVSARTRYERFYPGQPLCWKAAAFAHEVNEIYERTPSSLELLENSYKLTKTSRSLDSTDVSSSSSEDSASRTSSISSALEAKEVLSFGDSMEERTAVRIVADQLAAIPKSVMFLQSPTPRQIVGQLEMVTSHMKFICFQTNALDLEISTEQAEDSAEQHLNQVRPSDEQSTISDELPEYHDAIAASS